MRTFDIFTNSWKKPTSFHNNSKFFMSLLSLLSFIATNTASADEFADRSKLSLSSHAIISIPADELQLSIGVITLAETAEAALQENNIKMQAVAAALETSGIPKSDYKTSRFNIHPTYTPYPKDPPRNWKPAINGYEVSNTVLVKTEKLDLAGQLIDAVSKAGANSIDNINFGLKDPRNQWDEAISLATKNAMKDAEVIAAAAQIKLVQLLSITLENSNVITPQPLNMRFSKMAMNTEASTPIKSDDVEISSTVNVIYEIAPGL